MINWFGNELQSGNLYTYKIMYTGFLWVIFFYTDQFSDSQEKWDASGEKQDTSREKRDKRW